MKNNILINLEEIDTNGNILDISVKGNNIIPEIINKNHEEGSMELEKDFVIWNNGSPVLQDECYDRAYALFSLGLVRGRKNMVGVIREVRRTLKTGGKIMIWDMNISSLAFNRSYKIKVNLPQSRKGKIYLKTKFNPFRIRLADIIGVLENNNFKIIKSNIDGKTFFIEAAKEFDVKDENGISST
jgi:hypothetical protein